MEGTVQAWRKAWSIDEQCGPVVVPHKNEHGLSFPGMLQGNGASSGEAAREVHMQEKDGRRLTCLDSLSRQLANG